MKESLYGGMLSFLNMGVCWEGELQPQFQDLMVLVFGKTSGRIESISLVSWDLKWRMELKLSFGLILGVS
jgi:hypothetical protein